jgi:hypothetical protein
LPENYRGGGEPPQVNLKRIIDTFCRLALSIAYCGDIIFAGAKLARSDIAYSRAKTQLD